MNFCHISPTPHLRDFVDGRPFHLTLAHLIEVDDTYTQFYVDQKERHQCEIIMDNSAFEMYKAGRPMYEPDQLIPMAQKVDADYVVMTDYPGEHQDKTIEKAIEQAPQFLAEGFRPFFVPQSEIGDIQGLVSAYEWAANNPDKVGYIGVSILGVPNAYGVEKDNKLQRFMSRYHFMHILHRQGILDKIKDNGQLIHFLGMVDGPNETLLCAPFAKYINTWDSSAAVWAGLNGIQFDGSPTGLINGKFEKEVEFDYKTNDMDSIKLAKANVEYIDRMCERWLTTNA